LAETVVVNLALQMRSVARKFARRWKRNSSSDGFSRVASYTDAEAPRRPRPLLERTGNHTTLNSISDTNETNEFMTNEEYEALRADEDREALAEQQWVMKQLVLVESTSQFMDKVNRLVDEDWLGSVEAMPGNMYSIAAFGEISTKKADSNPCSPKSQKIYARFFGLAIIWLIQMGGPPAIFLSSCLGWGVPAGKMWKWKDWEVDLDDWQHVAVTKMLSILFIFGFVLNAIFVILDERAVWKRIDTLFSYLNEKTEINLSGEFFLYLGAITNCWVVWWCCLDTIVVLGGADSPKDVVFDSLGLLFLYNLDDISGDFGFIDDDDWDGARLGWVHEAMVKQEEVELDCWSFLTLGIYRFTLFSLYIMMILLPVVATVTSFTKIKPPDN